jgi:hypothetical protein
MQSSITFAGMKKNKIKVSLPDYANNFNPVLNRRGTKMSWGYLYRLIRQDIKGKLTKPLWFKYVLEGEKDRIFVIVEIKDK